MATKETKTKGLELPQMKGQFQVRGIVTGTQKEKFYTETQTVTKKPFRAVNFGIQYDKDSTLYVTLSGMEQEKVYFSKQETDGDKRKTVVKDVLWKDRYNFKEDGYKLIGVHIGVKKTKDTKGNDVNDKMILTPYDACKEIYEHLKDDVSVFVRGNIEYSEYEGKHMTKFVPNQVSLCKDIDFESEDYEVVSDFQQPILFMGIKPNEDKTKYIVDAKIVGFNSIEDTEFIITNEKLANMFRKNLKPYTSIKVWGNIHTEKVIEETTETDAWGEANAMEKIASPIIRELRIIGADPTTIDTTTYTEQIIDEAIEKIKANKKAEADFGKNDNDNWGSVQNKKSDIDVDEDDPW